MSNSKELHRAVEGAKPGATVLVADGRYHLNGTLQIRADGVTLRSASGNREKVILDADGMGEGIRVTKCKGVMIADLTLENVRWNGIKIDSETDVQKLTVYNCILHNIWQRGVKGVAVPKERREASSPSDCAIRYCLFYNDRAKSFADDSDDNAANFGGNYIAGIDVMYAREWTISDNVFVGIRGRTSEGRGAIFIWQDSRDCIVERNVIVDCDAGICLGNPSQAEPGQVHCRRFVIRNNFLTRVPENGIQAVYTEDCKILNNTIYDPASSRGRLIRTVADNPGLLVANNLLIGPPMTNEGKLPVESQTNAVLKALDVRHAPSGNLRLNVASPEVVDRATPSPDVSEDIDRAKRGAKPDIGAHEVGADR